MKNWRFTISKKMLLGFILLISIFAANAAYSIFTIRNSEQITRHNQEVVDPSVNSLNEFRHMVTRSKMLITNWVYMFGNTSDQQKLDNLHRLEYPELRQRISRLADKWPDSQQRAEMASILKNFEQALTTQKEEIMNNLTSFEDYEDSMVKFMAEDNLSSMILPQLDAVEASLEKLAKAKMEEKMQADENQISSFEQLSLFTIVLALSVIVIGLMVAIFLTRSLTRPIATIKEIVQQLGKGILPEEKNRKFNRDEIGEMAEAVEKLVAGLRSTSSFAESIGKGNYAASYQPLSAEDVLGNALINMRDNLQSVAEQDQRRNWATEGMAQFGDILRKNNDNINSLSDIIIANLVKYVKANQGGIYIVNADNENDAFLEMAACYAWDKKKYVEQKVYPGDGLTGQAWIEKDSILLTDIPQNYITITSGLGEASPNSIMIVPLKVNDQVYGLIEIASFNVFAQHEIEFVEKIAESIASTLSSVKINERTQKLLEESTELTEQMRAQEEEMRQNMEELQATQEEMQRSQHDRQEKENIISATNMLLELDKQFKINLVNNVTTQTLGYKESELHHKLFSSLLSSQENLSDIQAALENGSPWSGIMYFKHKKGKVLAVQVSAGRLRDPFTNSAKFLIFAANITEALETK
jgi:PAS domain S-box-containing protein